MDEAFTNWLKQSRGLKAGEILTRDQYNDMHRQYLGELAVNSYERGRDDGIGAVLQEFLTGKPAEPTAQQQGGFLQRVFTGGAAPSGEQQQGGFLQRVFTGGAAPSGEQQQGGFLQRVFTGGAAPSGEQQQGGFLQKVFTGGAAPSGQQQQGGILQKVFTGGAAPAAFSAAEFKQAYGVDLPAGNYRDPKGRLFTIR